MNVLKKSHTCGKGRFYLLGATACTAESFFNVHIYLYGWVYVWNDSKFVYYVILWKEFYHI